MAEWIRVDTDVLDHKKTILLSRALGESETTTVGRLVGLWSFMQIHAWKDGDLSVWGESGIERAARWDGAPGQFYKCAVNVGFLDGMKVHNSAQYMVFYARKRTQRERRKGGQKGGQKGGRNVDNLNVPSRTVQITDTANTGMLATGEFGKNGKMRAS